MTSRRATLSIALSLLGLVFAPGRTTAADPAAAPITVDGYLQLGFDVLGGFKYAIPPDAAGDQAAKLAAQAEADIPTGIKGYDGKNARVTGFMLPVKTEDGTGLVTDFLLVRDPMMCCYGVVHMVKPVPALQDVPISFVGKLHVGPIYDNGYLTGIYRLEGERKVE